MKCLGCGDDNAAGKLFCANCGRSLQWDGPTLTSAGETAAAAVAPARVSDVAAAQPARFLPGTVIAERYRIVAQIGRGGMGEVYRADDMRLGQTVALKFLPESLARDPGALARLNREVRMARQVSHPNVCRVFDIGEADSIPFITMEFVDGEDLASLLRRIGRLQQAKALQLAHQLCAGLAEIHAFGILHRDLKPANIMLDGRGNLRITDFGLAIVAQEIPGEEAFAGTPAYMAPEQLAGDKPAQQTDIYALGLILYELFTGKPAYETLRGREKSAARPTSIVKDLDPVIERAILRCLEKEPASRPRTATLVAAALPGGDPLAAAIAAGETPSPEMVAAAVDEPAIAVSRAWLCVAVFIVAIVGSVFLARYVTLDAVAPPEKPPEILEDNARQIIRSLGYTVHPADTAYWVRPSVEQLKYLTDHEDSRQWRRNLSERYPTPLRSWYRESPQAMESISGNVDASLPAMDVPGMVMVQLDQRGRLLLFHAVPPRLEQARAWPEPDWNALWRAAALPQASFASVTRKWQPPVAFDKQAAWEGDYDGHRFHVTAAALHGRPVYFEVFGPWQQDDWMPPPYPKIATVLVFTVLGALWIGGVFLARRNWRLGRGDRHGAVKIAIFVFTGISLSGVLSIHHVATGAEYGSFITVTGVSLHFAVFAALMYLALEPLVRRRWPDYLVCWNRLLAGRFNNPRVGRDVLIGLALGAADVLLEFIDTALPSWFNVPHSVLILNSSSTDRFPLMLGSLTSSIAFAVFFGVAILAVSLLLTLLVRRHTIALALLAVIFVIVHDPRGNPWIALSAGAIHAALVVFLLTRFGLVALVASFIPLLAFFAPLSADPSSWIFGRAALVLLILAAFVVYGFRAALAGRSAFGGAALDD